MYIFLCFKAYISFFFAYVRQEADSRGRLPVLQLLLLLLLQWFLLLQQLLPLQQQHSFDTLLISLHLYMDLHIPF